MYQIYFFVDFLAGFLRYQKELGGCFSQTEYIYKAYIFLDSVAVADAMIFAKRLPIFTYGVSPPGLGGRGG